MRPVLGRKNKQPPKRNYARTLALRRIDDQMEWAARHPVRRLALALIPIALALWGLVGCHRSLTTVIGPLPKRGYLWQRAWSPAVMAAAQEAGKHMDGMVVIGAEILWNGSTPETVRANIDWPTLKNAGKPIALALRVAPYPGPFSKDDSTIKYIADVAKSLLTSATAHGLAVSEFQLDFDCAQKKLSGYSLWVEAVPTAVRPTRFVITTLPALLHEPAFVPLVRARRSFFPLG